MKSNKLAFTALACLALLAGCAGPRVELAPESRPGNVMAGATLAFAGSCEVDVAPAYTELIMHRQRAARALRAGEITVIQAKYIQQQADSVRESLEAACPNRNAPLDVEQLRAARATLDFMPFFWRKHLEPSTSPSARPCTDFSCCCR